MKSGGCNGCAKIHAQKLEQDAIRIGLVHQRASRYVSDETLTRRREQKKRNPPYSRWIAGNQ
jgi:hypothetical protein